MRSQNGGRGRYSGGLAALPFAVSLLALKAAHAADGTWAGPGTQWTTGTNWSSSPTVPDGTATFTSNGAPTAVSVGTASIGTIQFDAVAPAYTFSVFGTFNITGTGIVNDSSNAPSFTNSEVLQFNNSSTAGNATIANSWGLVFRNSSTAGSATITNTGGVLFYDTSTAGNATITNRQSLDFNNGSTAGNATITNNTFATLQFNNSSNAGSASITNNNNGTVSFYNSSKGENATITNNGVLQFLDSSSAGSASTIANNKTLQFYNTSGAGNATITNNDTLKFNDGSTAGSATIANNAGFLTFTNSSTAGNATIANNDQIRFFSTSSAGSATINNDGGLTFDDFTKAGSATITNSGGLTFAWASTAESATIINNNHLSFTEGSTAGNARITTNSGATTGFFTLSTGGLAQFVVNGTGVVDFTWTRGTNDDNQVSAGSIKGDGSVIIGADNTLTVGGNNLSTVFGGVLSGNALVKTGTGTLTLSGTNTYTGGTTIQGGALQLGNGGTTGSILGDVVNNGMLAFNRSDSVTFGGAITGTGAVQQNGAGTTILTGTNSYAGTTTISAGTLQIGQGGTAGTLGTGNVVNNGTLVFNRSDAINYGGAISGTGAVQQVGAGTTILSGTSSYSGATTVSGGTLIVNGSIASSSGVTVAAGATLGGTGTVSTTVVNGTLSAGTSPGALTVNGDLTLGAGSTSLFELGTPGVVGGATNDLVVVNGNLSLGGTLQTPSAVSGYYRLFNVSGTTSGAFASVPSGATVTTNIPNQVNLLLRNGGQLVQFWDGADLVGNGTVDGGTGTFNAANTNWTGGPGAAGINDSWRGEVGVFAGAAGTVTVAGAVAFQGFQFSTTGYTLAGGTLTLSGDPHGNAAASFVNVDGGVTATIASVMSGTGTGLDKLGAGTLLLTGENTYTGLTTISAGTLQIGDGGTTGSIAGDVLDNGVLAFNRSNNLTFGGAISGTGAVQQNGAGTTILTADSTYTGGTTINAGTLQLGNGGTTGSILGEVVNNATFAVNRSDTLILGGLISGTGSFQQLGTGTTVFTAANTYTGGTVIDAGTLQLGPGGGLAATGALTVNAAGTFDLNGHTQTVGDLSGAGRILLGAGALTGGTTNSTIFSGVISGAGSLTKQGTGTLTLTETNTYTGGTTISAGTLQIGDGGTAGSIAGDVTNNAVLAFNRSNGMTFAGAISGTGSVQQNGAGTTILTATSSYTGGTTISAGTLQLGDGGTSGSIVGSVVNNGMLAINRSDTYTSNGTVSGTGGLHQVGTGTTVLTGNNSYTGGTLVSAGTLQLGPGGSLAAGSALQLIAGGTFDLNGRTQTLGDVFGAGNILLGNGTLTLGTANSTALSGDISGSGSLVKQGSGTFTLDGNSSYTGTTTVTSGALIVNGSIAGAVTVNDGAFLGGGGSVGGLTMNGGVLSPGNSIGTIAVNGSLVLSAATSYLVEVSPTAADRTNVDGTASLAGTLTLIPTGGVYQIGHQYVLLNATGGVSGTFATGDITTVFGPAIRARVGYDGNNVILFLDPNAISPFLPAGASRNVRNVAGGIDTLFAGGNAPPQFLALFNQTAASLPAALSQLSGEVATGVQQASFLSTGLFLNAMLDPFAAGRGEGAGFGASLGYAAEKSVAPDIDSAFAAVEAPPKPAAIEQRWGIWGAAYGGKNRTAGDALIGSHDLSATAAGFAAGADYRVSPDTVIGAAVAIGETSWSLSSGLGKGKADVVQAGAYGTTRWNAAYVSAALVGAWYHTSTDRTVSVAGSDRLEAHFDAHGWGGRVEGGYRFGIPALGVTPYAAVQVQSVHTPANAESATFGSSAFALSYNAQTTTDTRTELGAWTDARHLFADGTALLVRGRAAWVHDYDPGRHVGAVFQTLPGAAFTVDGAAAAADAALVSTVGEVRFRNGISLIGKFDGELAHSSQTYAGTGTVRYQW